MATLQTTAVTGSLTVTGQLIAQSLNVQQVTSSIVYSSGSNIFGKLVSDVQQLTGSLRVTGSGEHWIMGGSVGIGTTSPGYTLEVAGTSRFSGQATLDNQLLFSTSATNIYTYGRIGNTNAGRIIYNNGTGANMFFGELATNVYGVTGNLYTDTPAISFDLSTTRVGIGTNTPLNQVTIYDAAEPRIQLTSLSNYYSGSWIGRDSSGLYFIERQNAAIRFQTGGSDVMYITGSNVGIGTTNPLAKLEVKRSGDGDIFIGRYSGGSAKLIYAHQSSGDGFLELRTGADVTVTKLSGYTGTPSYFLSNVGIGVTNPSYILHISGSNPTLMVKGNANTDDVTLALNANAYYFNIINEGSGGNIKYESDDGQSQIFRTDNATGAPLDRFVIGSGNTANIYFTNANVGIGTTAPLAKFEAYYASENVVRLIGGGGTGSGNMVLSKIRNYSDNDPINLFWADHSTPSRNNTLVRIHTNETGTSGFPLRVTAQGTLASPTYEAIAVNYVGSVGVGTTSPSSKLHIESTTSNPFRMVRTGGTATNFGFEYGSGEIGFYDYTNSTYRWYIKSDGNVGIGTTSPSSKFHVYSTDGSPQGITITGGDETFIKFLNGTTKNWGLITTNLAAGDFGIYESNSNGGDPFTAGTVRLYFNENGNVGIGTSTVNSQLEVKGADSSTIQAIFQSKESTNDAYNGGIQLGNASSNQNSQIYHSSAGDNTLTFKSNYSSGTGNTFNFAPGGTTKVTFKQSGNVGIGTTGPNSTFHISKASADFSLTDTNITDARYTTLKIYAYDQNKFAIGVSGSGASLFNPQILINGANGNIGINNVSPAQKLDIGSGHIKLSDGYGLMWGTDTQVYASDASKYIRFDVDGTSAVLYASSSGAVFVNTTSNSNMGATSGSVKLAINGDQHFPRQGAKIYFGDVTDSAPLSIGEGDISEGGSDKDNMYIYHRNKLVIQGGVSGSYATKVGIGKTVPTYTLDVSGDFRVDSNAIFSNGNVGIGTTSATYRLTVYGPGTSNGVTLNLNDAASVADSRHILFTRSSSTGSIGIAGSKANDPLWLSRSGGYDLIIMPDGNVGIGTTAPADKLEIVNGTFYKIKTFFESTYVSGFKFSDYNGGIKYDAANDRLTLFANYTGGTNASEITFETSGSEKMRIDANGNVGIGTTSPATPLHVIGTISGSTFRSTTTGNILNNTYQTGTGLSIYSPGSGNDVILQLNRGGGSHKGSAIYVSSANYTDVSKQAFIELNAGAYSGASTRYLYAYDNSGDDFIMYGDGSMYVAGSIGVGTTSIGYKLDVRSSNTSSEILAQFQNSHDALNEYALISIGQASYKAYFGQMLQGADVAYMGMSSNPSSGNGIYYTTANRMGVNKVQPTVELDVNGYILSSGSVSVVNPAKQSTSTFTSPQEIMDAGWAQGNGLYYINPGGQLNASVQVYVDFTTRDYKGETGWMLVASWNTDYLWPTNTATTTGVLDSTAADRWSANFGNFEVQDLRVHAGATVDSGGSNSSDDWYYHRDSPIAWKKWWSPSSGATGLYPRSTTTNPSIRDGIIGFDWSYNLKFAVQNAAHKSNGMSDAAGTIDFWTALTTNGQSININGIAGDGSFAWSPTLANTGQDIGGQQGMVGYDDTSATYYYGPAYNSTGGTQGASTASTKLWLWVKGVSKNNLWSNNPLSTNIYASNTSANVGIGTTSPSTQLHVYQPSNASSLITAEVASSNNDAGLVMKYNGTTYFGAYGNPNTGEMKIGGFNASGYYMSLYSNNSVTMTIKAGNVGIGSTSPVSPLEIYTGTPKITLSPSGYSGNYRTSLGARSNAEGVLQFGNNGNNYIAAGNTGTGGALYFYTNCNADFLTSGNGNAAMLLTAGGNTIMYGSVGIGSTSPAATLDLSGTFKQSTTSTQPMLIYGDSGDTNGLFRVQIDSVSDSFGTGARTFLGDGGIDIFIGTANSSYTPGNTYMALNHSGEISMGAGSATKHFVLSTGGTLTISGDVVAYSDARVKKDVLPLTGALEKVMKIQGVSYVRTDIKDDESTKIGFIAQEVKDVLPEVVNYDKNNDRYSVAYGNITALLVEAIKELKAEIDILKNK